jgi:hypothetical protein
MNPWDPKRWTCGSSSGSGAIVSAGLAAFALGSETWGSNPVPAFALRRDRAGEWPDPMGALGNLLGYPAVATAARTASAACPSAHS